MASPNSTNGTPNAVKDHGAPMTQANPIQTSENVVQTRAKRNRHPALINVERSRWSGRTAHDSRVGRSMPTVAENALTPHSHSWCESNAVELTPRISWRMQNRAGHSGWQPPLQSFGAPGYTVSNVPDRSASDG